MEDRLYTTHQISTFCRVYPTTVINWINEGKLSAFTTPGGHRRVKKSDLIDFIKKHEMPMPAELTKGNAARVLVIDDDPKIAKMVKTLLEAEVDLEVSVTKNAFEAGIRVSQWAPDLILLDILMPEIDGFEVCRRLKQSKMTKDIPVIAITVLKDEKNIKKMRASGFIDYLAKPFKSRDLIKKVRKYLHIWQK
ncbi:MAG: response regulator [Omnitrophica bacterium]|nr:response regulator [Candidatus Omnitrophota bacterium]